MTPETDNKTTNVK